MIKRMCVLPLKARSLRLQGPPVDRSAGPWHPGRMAHPAPVPNPLAFTPRPALDGPRKLRREGPWLSITSRENSTPADTWTEELCVREAREPGVFHLAVCGTYRGRRRPMADDSWLEVTDWAPGALEGALRALGWPVVALPDVQEALCAMQPRQLG
jgi:hypothetical protein